MFSRLIYIRVLSNLCHKTPSQYSSFFKPFSFHRFRSYSSNCYGFSFIEVIIAAFIFSTAILPLISLSIANLQTSTQLKSLSTANLALNNLSQSISINREYVTKSGRYSVYLDQSFYQLDRLGSCEQTASQPQTQYQCFCTESAQATIEVQNCQTLLCSSEQLALYDIHQFSCALAKLSDSYQIHIDETIIGHELKISKRITQEDSTLASLVLGI